MTDMVDKAFAWDATIRARMDERAQCAKIAEQFADQGRDGYQIAKAIRTKGQLRGSAAVSGAGDGK